MKTETLVEATAIVTLTLEVRIPDRWTSSCSAKQIHDEAARAAQALLDRVFTSDLPKVRAAALKCIRFVGEPRVRQVLTDRSD